MSDTKDLAFAELLAKRVSEQFEINWISSSNVVLATILDNSVLVTLTCCTEFKQPEMGEHIGKDLM